MQQLIEIILSTIDHVFEITSVMNPVPNLENILGHIKGWYKLFGLVGWLVTDVETIHNWMLELMQDAWKQWSSESNTSFFTPYLFQKYMILNKNLLALQGSNSIIIACLGSAAPSQVCKLHGDRSIISLVCFYSNGWLEKKKQNKRNYMAPFCQILFNRKLHRDSGERLRLCPRRAGAMHC